MFDPNKVTPLKDTLLIEITQKLEQKTKGGLWLPQCANKVEPSPNGVLLIEGVIHKVGHACREEFQEGQAVHFDVTKAASWEDGRFHIVYEEDVWTIIEDPKPKKPRKVDNKNQ